MSDGMKQAVRLHRHVYRAAGVSPRLRRIGFSSLRAVALATTTVCAGWLANASAQTNEAPVATSTPDDNRSATISDVKSGKGAGQRVVMEPVVVQGVRLRDRVSQNTLSNDDMKQLPGTGGDPMRAAQSLPGVASTDDGSAAPALRGAGPSDNAYYVDFLPVGYLYHVGGLTSIFNGDLIRRFDMYSTAWSPEYGDVLGAVFDISLRRPREDKIGGKIETSLLGSSLLVEGPIKQDVSFFLAGRRSFLDLLAKTGQDNNSGATYTMPVYSDTQGRLLWNLGDSHRVRLDFSTATDRVGFSLKPDATWAKQEPVLVGNSTQRQSFNSVAAIWDANWGQSGSNTIALGRMSTYESNQLGAAGKVQATVASVYLREQAQFKLALSHELTTGFDITRRALDFSINSRDPRCTEFDPNCSISNAPQVQARQVLRQDRLDAYLNDRWRLAPQWTLTSGLRLTRDNYLKATALQPRLGMEWAWTAQTTFTAGMGRHSESPSLDQSVPTLGNPALAPLQSNQVAVGMAQKLDGGWFWRAEAYKKRFTGLVLSDPLLNYRNGGSGMAHGVELLVKKDASTKLSGFLSLTLAQARRRNDCTRQTFAFDYDEPVTLASAAQYKLSERWQFGAKWSYHSGAPFTPIVGAGTYPDSTPKPIYGAINSQRVAAYHRLDLRADWHYSDHLTGYAEIINVYARKNVAGYTYNADYSTHKPVYQLPFMPSAGVQYSF